MCSGTDVSIGSSEAGSLLLGVGVSKVASRVLVRWEDSRTLDVTASLVAGSAMELIVDVAD